MLGQGLLEDRKTARVFSFELHAGWAADMRLLDTKTIKHHQDIVGGTVLAVGRRILRHVRWRIAARGIGDGPVAPTKMLKLLFPAAVIAGEFMDEDDRRSASSFLIV